MKEILCDRLLPGGAWRGEMSKPVSKFEAWFRAQHGKEKLAFKRRSIKQLQEMVAVGRQAEAEIFHRQVWGLRYTSALWASAP